MDDSWRFRPSTHHSLCPTCSTSHFPFCPPPPTFDRYTHPSPIPRHYAADLPPLHRPYHHAPPLPVPLPMPPPRDPDPLRPIFFPSTQTCNFHEEETYPKRMRLEDPHPLGNFPAPTHFPRYDLSPPRILSDAERRLNLIREHGQQSAGPTFEDSLPVPANPYEGYRGFSLGTSSQYVDRFLPQERRDFPQEVFEARRIGDFSSGLGEYLSHGSYGHIRQFDPSGYRHIEPVESSESYVNRASQGGRYGKFDESLGNCAARAPENYRQGESVESLPPQNYRNGDTRESSENYVGFGSQSYRGVDSVKSSEIYAARATQGYRHGDPNENSGNYVDRTSQSYRFVDPEKYAVRAPEERPLYDSRPHPDFYSVSDYDSQGTFQKYHAPDHKQIPRHENPPFLLPNHPQYPHRDNRLPPNVMNHEQESNRMFHDMRLPLDNRFEPHGQHDEVKQNPFHDDSHRPFDLPSFPAVEQSCGMGTSRHGGYLPMSGQVHNSQPYPPLPPEPFPAEHPEPPPSNFLSVPSLSEDPPVPSPAPSITTATMPLPPNNAYTFSETQSSLRANLSKEPPMRASTGYATEGLPLIHQTPPKLYPEDEGQTFPLKHAFTDRPTVVDASHLFKQTHRASRPDHFVIILRGLPGSGKSYLAKALRDIEIENGGSAPRIHAMDDYFMIEVEKKVEDNDGSKSSSSIRGRKQTMKKVIEYCYEPEMEEAYRSSMFKAFKKTLEEGIFTFIIVDDRNLRVADFAQFWAIAKRSGYEVYLLEATYKDPAGCAARNVHGFTLDDIHKMAEKWEEAPSLYLQLDVQSLFHGDDLNELSIKEVDMDTDDSTFDGNDIRSLQDEEGLKMTAPKSLDYGLDGGLVKVGDRWDTEEDEEPTMVKGLQKSKWSKDLDKEIDNLNDSKENSNANALSGLMQAYGRTEKSVHWGDRIDKSGFSIGAVKKTSISSLIIGPGSGYNLNSNPLAAAAAEEGVVETCGRSNANESKKRFNEQLLAERQSFKAIFDRRRHRIGGLTDAEDEQ